MLLGACSGGAPVEAGQPSELDELENPPSTTGAPASPTPPATTPPSGGPWIASLGDSFISGEAGRWAGNSYVSSKYQLIDALGPTAYFDSPDGKTEVIPLCHRSTSAMVHIGDDGSPGGTGSPVGSTNLACSGAETNTKTEDGAFKPGLDFVGDGTAQQGQASMLRDLARQQNVEMVLVSIGGNDFGFADVIIDCVTDFAEDRNYCSDDPSVTGRISPDNVKKVTNNITAALQNVRKAMRDAGRADGTWTLVVNLNPDTLALGDDFRYDEKYDRYYDGGCGVYNTDAQWAGTTFVGVVRSAAATAMGASGISPAVLLDLSDLLDARGLCTKSTLQVGESGGPAKWTDTGAVDISEWANEIRKDDAPPYFSQESLHPDYWGQLAARSCVRQLYAAPKRVDSICSRTGTGLTSRGEPVVTLQPRPSGG